MCQVWKAMDEIHRKDAILYSPAQVKIKGILPPKSQNGKKASVNHLCIVIVERHAVSCQYNKMYIL